MFCKNCLEKNGIRVGSYDAYAPCADCEVMKDLYHMVAENFDDKIQEYIGKTVTFVDDKNGKTKTGKLSVGTLLSHRDCTLCLYNQADFLVAVLRLKELENVSDAHTRMTTHGALFYGPFFL